MHTVTTLLPEYRPMTHCFPPTAGSAAHGPTSRHNIVVFLWQFPPVAGLFYYHTSQWKWTGLGFAFQHNYISISSKLQEFILVSTLVFSVPPCVHDEVILFSLNIFSLCLTYSIVFKSMSWALKKIFIHLTPSWQCWNCVKSMMQVFSPQICIFLTCHLSVCHAPPPDILHDSRLPKLAYKLKVWPDDELCCNWFFPPKHCF